VIGDNGIKFNFNPMIHTSGRLLLEDVNMNFVVCHLQ
jgi:hypothetical protein